MHFHYVLLHISGPWTIHLIGWIFFNKFTTNTFIPIDLLLFLFTWKYWCRSCLCSVCHLFDHKHITEMSSNWSLRQQQHEHWQTGSWPGTEIFEQLWHQRGWHVPRCIRFNDFRFSEAVVFGEKSSFQSDRLQLNSGWRGNDTTMEGTSSSYDKLKDRLDSDYRSHCLKQELPTWLPTSNTEQSGGHLITS